ncbi:MAG: hypothetical protein K2Q24_10950 [Chitinophagaceae bacterium]|jgi:hypothetical protein|nr:hypothetical protein [Chitinophagaceae bacterium]
MKQLSFWASRHTAAARVIIILFYIPLNICGYYTGMLLWDIQIELKPLFINTLALLIIGLFLLYKKNAPFYKRKLMEGSMGVCTFCIICFYGNQINNPQPYFPLVAATQAVTYIKINERIAVEENLHQDKESSLQHKELKKQLKKIRPSEKENPVWVKVLLIILTLLVALWLIAVLTFFACSLSCNGAEAAAWIIGIIGVSGIIVLVTFVIRTILGRKKKRKKRAAAN